MIRKYNPNDLKELVSLLKLNTPKYFLESEEADFIDYLKNHREDYFVFEENNTIIGSGGINYFPETHSARISWDIIHPDFQSRGIGTSLTKFRLHALKQNPAISSVTVRTSQLVFKFYEKMGFRLEKTEKNFWGEGFDLYQMTLELK